MDLRTTWVAIGKAGVMALLMAVLALWATVAIAGVNEDLIMAIEFGGDLPKVKRALANGADVNFKLRGITPLMRASTWAHKDIVQLLLAKGADVNAKSNSGSTALIYASMANPTANQREVVQLLLANGADVNAKSEDGWTALMDASARGNLEVVQLLLAKGADVNAKNKNGETALYWASEQGYRKVKELLIKAGAK